MGRTNHTECGAAHGTAGPCGAALLAVPFVPSYTTVL
jgi:hypothetical protein